MLRHTLYAICRNGMKYSLSDAAKAAGKNKTTIQRAIKNGRISAIKNDLGAYEIDPAELHRVFPPATAQRDAPHRRSNGAQQPVDAPRNGVADRIVALEKELAVAQARNVGLEEQRQQMTDTIDDLRARLNRAEDRVTALLGAPDTAPRRRLFGWWSRGK